MSSYAVGNLLEKMKHPDQDFRFMALQDLQAEMKKPSFTLDGATEERTVDQVLQLMNDSNTEVKNHAVKTIGALVTRVQQARLFVIIEQLTAYTSSKDEQLRDIANLGLRTVIRDMPTEKEFGEVVCTNLAPKLLEQLNNPSLSQETKLGSTELLADLFARFEPNIRSHPELQTASANALVPLLGNQRAAVRKRAVDAIGFLAASASDDVLNTLFTTTILPALTASSDVERLKTGVGLVGAVASRAPHKTGQRLRDLLPRVLQAMTAKDDDDLRETCLQTIERILLKCPREAASFITQIIEAAAQMIKHDPNYEGADDDDEEMDVEEDQDEEDFADDYEDDDDQSWKVRRAATKVLGAVIETRPELLPTLFRTISPILISRSKEREESVRIEVWQTYTKLLSLVKVFGDAPPAADSPTTLKRKRDHGDMRASPMDVDDSPLLMLRQQYPQLVSAVLKQLAHKSIPARLAGFALLRHLTQILRGGMEDQVASLLSRVDASFASSDSGAASGSGTALKIEILAFLQAFFTLHPVSVYEGYLASSIIPRLTKALNDKYNKVAAQAFAAASALVRSLRPVPPQEPVSDTSAQALRSIYEATLTRLEAGATDQEVREAALSCLGDLLYHAGDALAPDFQRSLGVLREAVRRETTRVVAVRVAGHIAQSPACRGAAPFAAWVQDTIGDVAQLLKQINRTLRVEAFASLPQLIEADGGALSQDGVEAILGNIQPYLSEGDAYLIPSAYAVLNALLTSQPGIVSTPTFTSEILPRSHALATSPIVHGASLEALIGFFGNLVYAGVDAKKLSNDLVAAGTKAASGTGKDVVKPAYGSIARCLGAVVMQSPNLASTIAKQLIKQNGTNKAPVFGLLALGQIGRTPDLPEREKAFTQAHALFDAPSEETRLAAAFAVGNLAVGSPEQCLPQLVQYIRAGNGDDRKRNLALAAVKEFIVHSSAAVLAPSADALWDPLVGICAVEGPPVAEPKPVSLTPDEVKARDKRVDAAWKASEPVREQWKVTEVSRTMAAECLGKITLADPQRYLAKLQNRLQDKLAGIRAAAVSSLRFTFTDDSAALDELLAPSFVNFMSLMRDSDLDVRRLTLSTLNSAAHHKPQLIRPHLPTLLPMLYSEMAVDQSLIRLVEMGPFKHKVDDGLEVRKAAYETSYTLLDTCLNKIDTHELLTRVLAGISDDHEIRAISYLMLIRLAIVAPTSVTQRLDSTTDAFDKTLNEKLKDGTVKQEQEKHTQMQKAALRAFAALSKIASPASTPKFSALVHSVGQGPWASEFKLLRSESGPINGASDAMDIDS